jgi:hypothetical protein
MRMLSGLLDVWLRATRVRHRQAAPASGRFHVTQIRQYDCEVAPTPSPTSTCYAPSQVVYRWRSGSRRGHPGPASQLAPTDSYTATGPRHSTSTSGNPGLERLGEPGESDGLPGEHSQDHAGQPCLQELLREPVPMVCENVAMC